MGKVNDDAVAVHLGYHIRSEVGESAVVGLVATAADQVLSVVGELHNPDAELGEDCYKLDVVFEGRRVLKAEDYSRFLGLDRQPWISSEV